MLEHLSKYCKSKEQVDKITEFIVNQEFDTDSAKLDTQNREESNLVDILSSSQAIKTMIDFLNNDSGLRSFHICFCRVLTC